MNRALFCYLLVCVGMGAVFGSFGWPVARDFFCAPLYIFGFVAVFAGVFLLPSQRLD